jgi:hypothetical protein
MSWWQNNVIYSFTFLDFSSFQTMTMFLTVTTFNTTKYWNYDMF